jgi:hypothetical protein
MIIGVMPSAMKPVRVAIGWLLPMLGFGHLYGVTPKVSPGARSKHAHGGERGRRTRAPNAQGHDGDDGAERRTVHATESTEPNVVLAADGVSAICNKLSYEARGTTGR